MLPKLCAFDLDGTLLRSNKTLSPANQEALRDMARHGVTVALASGRFGTSVLPYAQSLGINPALLTLNGAAVYTRNMEKDSQIFHAPLDKKYARQLISFAENRPIGLNFYKGNQLTCLRNQHNKQWIDLYHQQTKTPYQEVADMMPLAEESPSKLLFVGAPETLDPIQEKFRKQWQGEVYVCRTWDYYLEFMNIHANKGKGLTVLAEALGIGMAHVAAFGDAENDIPMLEIAGMGVAMQNASPEVKQSAHHVSQWTNDEDGVAKEWERLKQLCGE